MKAIVYEKYGTPEVHQLREVKKPGPNAHEVLVKVHASSVNPYEYIHTVGSPYLVRVTSGFFRPKHHILGADIAGVVEAVGKHVTRFRPGDQIFGEGSYGAYAEYACVKENKLALKPTNIDFTQAGAVGMAGITALQGLRDKGKIQSGQLVLINGASGGVGTFTVQLAKYFGTTVTGVCSTNNLELIRSIGADHAIDYTQEDFTNSDVYAHQFDLIYDAIGNLTISDYVRLLKPGGTCVVIGYTSAKLMMDVMLKGPWASQNRKIITMTATVNSNDLEFLKELLEKGEIITVIDRSYPLPEVPEALRYLSERRARGKVVISVV